MNIRAIAQMIATVIAMGAVFVFCADRTRPPKSRDSADCSLMTFNDAETEELTIVYFV
ncbi:MAG TPA: hypothetical protein VGJ20_45395 [Xanthobacteraceae bacterium]